MRSHIIVLYPMLVSVAFGGKVRPDLTKMEGLICYQCESNGTEKIPLCDTAFFKTLSISERYDIMFQCPARMQNYCIRKTVIQGNTLRTFRGCTGPVDSNNVTVRNGCIDLKEDKTRVQVCLCDRNLCNKSCELRLNLFWVEIHFITILIMLS
ncbi:Sleepless protein [Popillia japonica]|uniref:Sleepless protein n=1 Tax=Popillia japonica TaxID=7064 RepID=A0AAW1IYR2_POPJA